MARRTVDVVVVGAGFAGLYMLKRLRDHGWSVRVFETGSGVGGTWYWNRYPGARCDVPSMEYSYSFDADLEQQWDWTERYATQPEILAYLEHVAERFDLNRDITFDTRVASATFDEDATTWEIRTSDGDTTTARFLVMATGCLSAANTPDIPGLESFAGPVYHTGRWPHEGVDFIGKRVAVIGTGSSGIQSIPVIAREADQLTVFQRTANFSIPANNYELDEEYKATVKAEYPKLRAENRATPVGFGARSRPPKGNILETSETEWRTELEARWDLGGLGFLGGFIDALMNKDANDLVAGFVKEKIAEIVDDPEVADALTPDTVIGCKRLCVDTGYYETFNRDNVRLVDLRKTPIESIEPTGVRTTDESFDVDVIVLATGFDAMTGALMRIDITGRNALTLRKAWSEGPRTYLGVGVPGFPNMFIITGPGSPSVLTNMVTSIEQHVEWITDCIDHMRAAELATIEAKTEDADQWVQYVNSVAGFTLFTTCNSWYLGANIPGKPRVFMPLFGFNTYADLCRAVAADGYRGFALAPLSSSRGAE
jgi:cyclohexanone monooxygenase